MIDLEYSLIIEATKEPDFLDSILLICRAFPELAIPLKTVFTRQNGG